MRVIDLANQPYGRWNQMKKSILEGLQLCRSEPWLRSIWLPDCLRRGLQIFPPDLWSSHVTPLIGHGIRPYENPTRKGFYQRKDW